LLILFIIPNKQAKLTYNTMTAGQLLDVQLNIEEKINDLVTQKKIVQSLRDKKTSIIRQET
jgi:hypothetical protein